MKTLEKVWHGLIFSLFISIAVVSLVFGNWLTDFLCLFFMTIWFLSTLGNDRMS